MTCLPRLIIVETLAVIDVLDPFTLLKIACIDMKACIRVVCERHEQGHISLEYQWNKMRTEDASHNIKNKIK